MSITSLNFYIFLLISVSIYYIFPKKIRWIELLISSIVFFMLASSNVLKYLVFGIITSYIGALIIGYKAKTQRSKKIALFCAILIQVAELFLLKYINIIPNTLNIFGKLFSINTTFGTINLIAPIGISYYTLSVIAYLTDVYRTTIRAEKNIFKYSLFVCYYPCLISGPFIRYKEMSKEFFKPRRINWNDLFKGFHRFVFGLMKKLVIADNLAQIVNFIFNDTNTYSGVYIIIGVFLYAIQIYCDFSGCMDIVNGASKMYGVNLPENFDSPLLSRNLSEFWRRWHITLGLWGKDYIMYPLLKSNAFQKMGKRLKKKLGKKAGKKIPVLISILVLWLIIGIWHGAQYKYIFCAGILPWIYLTFGELFNEKIEVITKKLNINTENRSFHIFQSIRTLAFMMFIWIFAVSPNLKESIIILKRIFVQSSIRFNDIIPDYLTSNFDNIVKVFTILICLGIVFIVDLLKYRGENVAEEFNNEGIWFRWIALLTMISFVIIFGSYGPGYNPVDFIYGGF